MMLSGQTNYELLYLEGDYEQIISKANQQNRAEEYYWHSLTLSKQGNVFRSIEIMEEGIGEHPDQEKLELLLADLYYETGNFTKAKPLLEKHSNSHEMFIRLIELLEFQDSFQEAIDLLKSRIQEDPQGWVHL